MPEWADYKTVRIGSVDLRVRERMDMRNHHGAMEYIVTAWVGGEMVLTERHGQSVWLGHCCGQLLLPLIAKRAIESKWAIALVDELEQPTPKTDEHSA
jgi:hypothetical protein